MGRGVDGPSEDALLSLRADHAVVFMHPAYLHRPRRPRRRHRLPPVRAGHREPMTDTARADRFAEALRETERSGDPAALVSQFADAAELRRPELDKAHGPSSAPEEFWKSYLAQFSQVSTEFTHVAEEGALAILEWTSTGTLEAGRDIEYQGVSLLAFDGDAVSRFSTYYDTAAFVVPAT
jgi:SnoaL-like domain